VPGN